MIKFLFIFIFGLSCLSFATEKVLDLSQLNPKLQQTILKQTPRLKSGRFTLADLDQLMRFLLSQEQYDSAAIAFEQKDDREFYKIVVGSTKRISALKFIGNENVSETELKQVIGISEKAPFDQDGLIEGGERIRLLYKERGFHNTVVDLEFANVSINDVDVTVKISEGVQTKIGGFVLNIANPNLKEKLEWRLNKRRDDPLTDSLLSDVQKEMREYLSDNHFYRADIHDPTISFSKGEGLANIEYKIDNVDEYFVDFNGNADFTGSALKEAILLDTFFSSNPNISAELANRLKAFYLSQGYARAEVRAEETETARPFEKTITFEIDEGPRIHIESIQITGRFTMSNGDYTDFIRDHSTALLKKGIYVSDDLDVGIKNMVIERQNNGYLKAHVISTRKVYTGKDRDQVTIYVNFDEGPLTLIQNIIVEGNTEVPEAEIRKIIGFKTQQPLKLNELEEAIQRLKQFYRDQGYLEMSLPNEKKDLVNYNEDNTLALLKFKIYEGPKVKVASILIEGNLLTKDYVILKELEFSTGDVLTPQAVEESINRLQRLGHFNTIEIRTLEEKTSISNRTVVVRVTEANPGLYNIGIGATNERNLTIRGFTGWAYRNIYGSGRGVSVRVDGNYNISGIQYLERKVALGYLEPYLFNTRIRGRVSYTQSIYITQPDPLLAQEVKQSVGSIEQDITSHVTLSWDLLSLAHYKSFSVHDDPPSTFTAQSQDIGSTGPTLEIDYRDKQFNPTKGSFTRLNVEYGSPALYSDSYIEYIRTFGSFTHYQPLKRTGWIWANSIRGGTIENLKTGGYVPYDVKGFQLGGQSTIRGISPANAFPNEKELGAFANPSYQLTSIAKMLLYKTELRFPIYKTFGGALFYDNGMVSIENQPFYPNYRHSIGVALRIETPVGPINFEYGWNLNMQGWRGEEPAVFHFSIGTF